MRRRSPVVVLLCVAALAAGAGVSPVSAHPPSECAVTDPALEGPPAGLPATEPVPVRTDPDGARTLLLAVDDPVFGGDVYQYTPVAASGAGDLGVYAHRWNTARRIVTYGAFALVQGTRYRMPLFLVENGVSDDATTSLLAAAMSQAAPAFFNAAPFVLNTALPSSAVVATGGATLAIAPALLPLVPVVGGMLAGPAATVVLPVAGSIAGGASMYANNYPFAGGFVSTPPVYVWTAYRNAGAEQVWAGNVTMNTATYSSTASGSEGCRRARIGIATRTSAGTTYVGGVYVLEHAVGTRSGDTFEATNTVTAGMTAGGTDVPVTSLHETETKRGSSPFSSATGFYPSYQRDELTINARVGDRFVPLIGTRAEAAFAAPPQAENRLVSVGVYDPLGAYHPVVGGRTHFEKAPADLWTLSYPLAGGPGARVGDWEADLGTFDPLGNFVPVFGVTYDDAIHSVPSTRYAYQMMITAGPWVAGSYVPALGATYDGETPFVYWALANAAGSHAGMGRWLVSAGAFSPLGSYVPVAGASYEPGTNPPYPIVEEYRIGAFTASYPDFVPVAEARWSGYQTSGAWASAYGLSNARASTEGRIDAGPVVAGTFTPVVGMHHRPGRPQHFDFGPWVLGGFVPLLTACFSSPVQPGTPGPGSLGPGSVGVGVAGTPLLWVGNTAGGPSGGARADCPA